MHAFFDLAAALLDSAVMTHAQSVCKAQASAGAQLVCSLVSYLVVLASFLAETDKGLGKTAVWGI